MVEKNQIIFIVLLGMMFSIFMITGMFLFARKNKKIKELSEKIIEEEKIKSEIEKFEIAITIQEKERSVIARKLHDDVGALLSIVHKNILKLKAKASGGEVDIESLAFTESFVKESINQLRSITKDLIPHYLLKFGLSKAMERIGSAKSESLNVKFTFESNLSNNSVFSEEIMINVFYIGNELITNLLKHSFPTVIGMTLNLEGNQLKLQLKHDGIALSQRDYIALSKETENLGLENIRYRLNIIKGDLTFQRNNTLGEINFLVSI
ncbi:MAG: hypothetical protein RIQ59_1451 [Bacteroidota bacterium]|jgi:signal transduction histidine kinase